ncbi:hypothetical protein GCM10027174_04490 [Salinifilum aidingensis]
MVDAGVPGSGASGAESPGSGPHCEITAVVGAESASAAVDACSALAELLSGEVAGAVDCSAEEPGCWAVTIRRAGAASSGAQPAEVTLSGAVRRMLRALGAPLARGQVHCAPPTAWAVLEHPELLAELVPGGERLLLEAHSDPL